MSLVLPLGFIYMYIRLLDNILQVILAFLFSKNECFTFDAFHCLVFKSCDLFFCSINLLLIHYKF